MILFSVSLLFLSVMYAGFIFWCFAGWKKINLFHSVKDDFKTSVSIVVPARNEESTIFNCLTDLLRQNYPTELIEIIVVDDHSTDDTVAIVNRIIAQHPDLKIVLLNNNEEQGALYKKQAITHAIQKSSGKLIVTTDADCRMLPGWLAAIVSYYETEHPWMIAGPVCFSEEKNTFEKLQSLEFMGLIGIGAGSISNHQPVMCNGANLAYSKKIFLDVNGFSTREQTASGDDTELLGKISKIDSSKIHFLKSSEAVVYTSAMSSVNALLNQRKRWASKIPMRMSLFTLIIAVIAYTLHLELLITFFFSMFHPVVIPFFLVAFLLKIIPEYLFLNSLGSFFRKKNSVGLFLPAQMIYMMYISVIGLASLVGSYQWKGREIKTPEIKFPA